MIVIVQSDGAIVSGYFEPDGEGDGGHYEEIVYPGESYAGVSYEDLVAGGTREFDLEELQRSVRDRMKERVVID